MSQYKIITWDETKNVAGFELSEDKLTVTMSSSYSAIPANESKTSGKFYWEITVNEFRSSHSSRIGVIQSNTPLTSNTYLDDTSIYYTSGGHLSDLNGNATSIGEGYGANDVIGIALDLDNSNIKFYKNNQLMIDYNYEASLELFPAVASGNAGDKLTANFGATDFAYNPPSGYESFQKVFKNKYLFKDGTDIKKYVLGTGNQINENDKSSLLTLSNNNLTVSAGDESLYPAARAIDNITDKKYFEVTFDTVSTYNANTFIGVANASQILTPATLSDFGINSKVWRSSQGYTIGDTIGLGIDMVNFTLDFYKNGIFDHTVDISGLGSTIYPFVATEEGQVTFNFGASNFIGSVPTGYDLMYSPASWSIVGTAPATKTIFDIDGMEDLSIIDNNAIQQLTSDTPELLCWTDEKESLVYSDPIYPSLSSATSTLSGTYVEDLFDGVLGGTNYWSNDLNALPVTISFTLSAPEIITKYDLTARGSYASTQAPQSWTFEAYDGSNWIILDSKNGINNWSNGETKEFTINNNQSYSQYRIIITANGGGSYTQLSEIEVRRTISHENPSRNINYTAIPHNKLLMPIGDISVGEIESVRLNGNATQGSSDINAIPVMTSNTSPSGVASASSGYYEAWNAFNESSVDYKDCWASDNNNEQWIQYAFDSPIVINKISMSPRYGYYERTPRAFTIQASNTGKFAGEEVILHEVAETGEYWISDTEEKEWMFKNSSAYQYYRIHMTDKQDSFGKDAEYTIGYIKMFEAIKGNTDLKVIVSGDNGASWKGQQWDGAYTEDITPNMTSDVSDDGIVFYHNQYNSVYAAWKAFDGDWSIINGGWFTDSPTNGYIGYDFANAKVINKYVLYPRNLDLYSSHTPNDDMPSEWDFQAYNKETGIWDTLHSVRETDNIGDWERQAPKEFIFDNDKKYNKYRLFIVSSNGTVGIGEIQMMEKANTINTYTLPDIKLTTIKEHGFTPSQLNTLTKEELATLFPNGTARFAFYLEQEKSTDTVEIQSLTINEKQYTMTPSIENINVIYELLESEKPTYYVSRDNGQTWKEIKPDELVDLSDLPEGNQIRIKAVLQNGQELHGISYSWI